MLIEKLVVYSFFVAFLMICFYVKMAKKNKKDVLDLAEEFKKEKLVEPEEEDVMTLSFEKDISELKKQIKDLQQKQHGIPKQVLLGISDNINITLHRIGTIEAQAKDIQEHEQEINKTIIQLENENRLWEADNIRDLERTKLKRFVSLIPVEFSMLRNELEQLQSKIRSM